MYDIFGEFDSAAEINEAAAGLKREGDTENLYVLAKENGIDAEMVEIYLTGEIDYLADDMSAAIGKIDIESEELKPDEIMEDWVEYLKAQCFQSEAVAKAVRSKQKSLKGCMAALLKWSFTNAKDVDKDVVKAAGVNAKVKLGIPGMGRAKKIITEYYLGK